MNNKRMLTSNEMEEIKVGEPMSLATVMAIVAVALVAVIVYRLFLSKNGSVTLPGGWKFQW